FSSGDIQSRRRLDIGTAKHRDIVSLGNLDVDRIVLSGCQIIALERAAQPAGLDANDWIRLRIEARVPSKHRSGDCVGFDPLGLSVGLLAATIRQKPPIPIRRVKSLACDDALKLRS